MELLSSSRPNDGNSITRRAWLLTPFSIAAGAAWFLTRQHALPNPSESGSGQAISIVLFDRAGRRLQTVEVKKLVKSPDEWRKQLGPEAFAVTRQDATEFAFHNAYWDNHKPGLYRCISCGNAVFSSKGKYDSETGWPSFTGPVAPENIATRSDHSLGMQRTEVLCHKCDAHLGHLFDDGPLPSRNRFCINSAALRFVPF